ncbi:MAG: glycosyltransferase [Opitutaceae bacterium]|nr:glycosyltransferase [Opitutaceae bacterium]
MNILFVNYGDFTTNSLNHIGGFASGFTLKGHSCVVAVTGGKETLSTVDRPLFIPATYSEVLERPNLFPDGRTADIIHGWTPRENVRRFVQSYQQLCQFAPRLVIHLEDNEAYLLEHYTGKPLGSLAALPPDELRRLLPQNVSHPAHFRHFLGLADGVTHIVERLSEFVPNGIPRIVLRPGVDFDLYNAPEPEPALRAELGLRSDEKVIVFTGSNTFANEPEMRDLYTAIAEVNRLGTPTRLIRTGFTTPTFERGLTDAHRRHVLDLGFVPKPMLPRLLALADLLVQPGRPGPFNDYRLPSKLPEFLASGKAVLLPACNLAAELKDGEEAIHLRSGTPEALAQAIREACQDQARLSVIGACGRAAAKRLFVGEAQGKILEEFYSGLRSNAPRAISKETLFARVHLAEADRLHAALDASESGKQQKLAELTRNHAENLEKLLRVRRATQKTASLLTKQHIRNLEETLAQSRTAALASETRLALANKRAADTELAARQKVEDLQAIIDRVKGELLQREDKIKRMQRSGSWRYTAVFRSLRRLLVDPLKPKSAQVLAATPAAHAPIPTSPEYPASATRRTYSYTYNIDHPLSWSTTSNRLLLLGWCFENEAAPISGVRVRIGDTLTEGSYGSKRLDVLASVGGRKQAEFCGVKVDARLELGDYPVKVEVKHDDGWYCFFETQLHVGKPGDPLELSEYQKWCAQHETLSEADQEAVGRHIAAMHQRPVFSILVPVYNPPVELFRKALDSVFAQIYPHWELCIADDCSTDPKIREVLEEYRAKDSRVRIVYRESNGHISLATNSAYELAQGEFVALFDHDDALHPQALYEIASAIDRDPKLNFIYTDEDKIDAEDRRFDPYFKPDWNPDLLHGQNYTSHLSVFRRELVAQVGAMRTGFEGSQDWDLTLRIVDAIPEETIHHVPRVLYHWRAIPGSTALQISEKSYPVDAAKRALVEHFSRRNETVELVPVPGDHWRIRYALPTPKPSVSLIIPTRNAEKLVRQAIESILSKTNYDNYEVVLVDNGSDDPGALAYFSSLPNTHPGKVRVLCYDAPFNYSAINNFAVRHCSSDFVGLINNDIEVISPEWLHEMVAQAARRGIGAVGAMLYYPNNTVQHAGVILGLGGVAGHAFKEFPRGDQGQKNRLRLVQNYSAVTGACLVIKRDRYLEVAGLDEKNLAVAFNDVDLCCKLLKAGYRNLWTPHAELYHHESATRGIEDTPEKKARFQSEVDYMMETWSEFLQNDPAYNPNLTLVGEDFSVAYLTRTQKSWARHKNP